MVGTTGAGAPGAASGGRSPAGPLPLAGQADLLGGVGRGLGLPAALVGVAPLLLPTGLRRSSVASAGPVAASAGAGAPAVAPSRSKAAHR